jgi:hypothetical protein
MLRVRFVSTVGLLLILVPYQEKYAQTPSKTEPEFHADWFSHQPVLGALPPEKQEDFLATLRGPKKPTLGLAGDPQKIVYTTTEHQFGFVGNLAQGGAVQLTIQQAATIAPDKDLKNAKIKITLDRLRVFHYPGSGRHNILFTFQGQNQVSGGNAQEVNFSQTYVVMEGQGAGIAGFPVFIGLNVGNDGALFKGHTTNVSNINDEHFLSFLKSSTFTNGLKLLDTLNPAIPVVSQFAVGIAEAIGSRNKNIGVQDFFLGLDFTPSPSGARLAQGSYIVVQAPSQGWNWSDWAWDTNLGGITRKSDRTPIPWNYVVFSVSKMQ